MAHKRDHALPPLTIATLQAEASSFAQRESHHQEPRLYGVTDGKALGTYLEQKFQGQLSEKYTFNEGSSASGIDFPDLNVDIKVTSLKQPQSSSPFKSAYQKIYGLGYSLLIFIYQKNDNAKTETAALDIQHVIFIDSSRTADYQTTRGIREIIDRDGNTDDLIAFMSDRNLPIDEIESTKLAEKLIEEIPETGYLTISNALQWRLQYKRAIAMAGTVNGILRVR